MRIVSFNIRHASSGLAEVARVLGDLAPDVVCLQEVDDGTRRSGGVDQPADFGHRLSMHHAFAPAMPFDGGFYGLAILSRWNIQTPRIIGLPHGRPVRDDGHGEPRVALAVETGGVEFACTHLGLDASEREAQVRTIRSAIGHRRQLVLAGDMNEGPGGHVFHELAGWLTDAFAVGGGHEQHTGPADRPQVRIDGIWCAGSFRVYGAGVGPAGVSDHLPVFVDLEPT